MSDDDQIRQALARWMRADDDGDDEFWLTQSVTEDFTFSIFDRVHAGLDEVRAFNDQRPKARGLHILSEPVIEVDGTSAAVTTDFVYVVNTAGSLHIAAGGRYHDRFVRDAAGRWRCTRRHTTRREG